MEVFGLNYGAVDMILTPDDRYVFLEINPAGEFFWLELKNPKFPVSAAIADVLLGEAPRR
jgi:D-alanine-D-alanine ligase-like ATP-grasp enzyme